MSRPSASSCPEVGGVTPEIALNKVVLPAPFGPMMPTSSPAAKLASTASTAVSPPKRTLSARASSSGSAKVPLPRAAKSAPRIARHLPAQRRKPARQIQDREDQQQAKRHHVQLRHLQTKCLGEQAEDDRRDERTPQRQRGADQCDQRRLKTNQRGERGGRIDVGPAHRHPRA